MWLKLHANNYPVMLILLRMLLYIGANVFAFPGIYNLTVFGGRTVGTVQGLMFTLSAPLNYLSSPLLSLTEDKFDGNFTTLNLGLIVVVAPVVCLALLMMCVTQEAGMFPRKD